MGKDIGAGEYQLSPYQDFIVVRYSDVLLMAAELGSPNAQSYLDAVRDRAFGGDTSKRVTATKENILKERMYEFAFEGLRLLGSASSGCGSCCFRNCRNSYCAQWWRGRRSDYTE